jgi:hypothetical protein
VGYTRHADSYTLEDQRIIEILTVVAQMVEPLGLSAETIASPDYQALRAEKSRNPGAFHSGNKFLY